MNRSCPYHELCPVEQGSHNSKSVREGIAFAMDPCHPVTAALGGTQLCNANLFQTCVSGLKKSLANGESVHDMCPFTIPANVQLSLRNWKLQADVAYHTGAFLCPIKFLAASFIISSCVASILSFSSTWITSTASVPSRISSAALGGYSSQCSSVCRSEGFWCCSGNCCCLAVIPTDRWRTLRYMPSYGLFMPHVIVVLVDRCRLHPVFAEKGVR